MFERLFIDYPQGIKVTIWSWLFISYESKVRNVLKCVD